MVVVLNVIDCGLVLGELMLDIHFVKGTVWLSSLSWGKVDLEQSLYSRLFTSSKRKLRRLLLSRPNFLGVFYKYLRLCNYLTKFVHVFGIFINCLKKMYLHVRLCFINRTRYIQFVFYIHVCLQFLFKCINFFSSNLNIISEKKNS